MKRALDVIGGFSCEYRGFVDVKVIIISLCNPEGNR